jgi:uncharacterized protein YjbI with pentapeptide repeats
VKPIRQLIRRLLDTAIDWWTEIVAIILLVVGLIGYFRGAEPYEPIFTEVIGISIAVLLIDLSNKFLSIRNEKKRLILQMGSPNNVFAIEAVRQLRARGWLTDGSLRGAYIASANLEGANLSEASLVGVILTLANLMDANLEEANLSEASLVGAKLTLATLMEANLEKANIAGANLKQAYLRGANLNRAVLSQANLEGAILDRADLRDTNLREVNMAGAYLSEANLKGAKVTFEQLAQAETLEGAIMPDGTVYNPETFNESQEEQEPPE